MENILTIVLNLIFIVPILAYTTLYTTENILKSANTNISLKPILAPKRFFTPKDNGSLSTFFTIDYSEKITNQALS